MKVIERDIGAALDALYEHIESRLRVEAQRTLEVEAYEGDAFSSVRWREGAVTVRLHRGVPKHALAHVFGVALQHVRQRLDRYPDVRRPEGDQPEGAPLLRVALRELVLAPEADMQLAALELDQEWEQEQRHQALKDLVGEPPPGWAEEGSLGSRFVALQYARFARQHPAKMWEPLREQVREALPDAAAAGEAVVKELRQSGWGTPGACLQSLLAARQELGLGEIAVIEDRLKGQFL